MTSFNSKSRSLLAEAVNEEQGTIKISIRKGSHLTDNAIIEAFKRRDSRAAAKTAAKKAKAVAKKQKKIKGSGKTKMKLRRDPDTETPAEFRDLVKLAPKRAILRKRRYERRDFRRSIRRWLTQQLRGVTEEETASELQHLVALGTRRRVLFVRLKANRRGRRMARMLRASRAATMASYA
ncbi:hypothetical protein FGB62_357g05 [Gracilaria domingensis]|nr:hypothetical protein FGB62_357g05 [Gracilaria domingensis]